MGRENHNQHIVYESKNLFSIIKNKGKIKSIYFMLGSIFSLAILFEHFYSIIH